MAKNNILAVMNLNMENKMTIEELRNNRKARLAKLHEALTNMPEIDGKKMHGEVGAVEFDAVKSSNERDEKVKQAMKEKNKETREFIKDMDKATDADKDEKAEDRLILDESLFNESVFGASPIIDELIEFIDDRGFDKEEILIDLLTRMPEETIRDYLDDLKAYDEFEG